MTDVIRIDYEALQQVAEKFAQHSEAIEMMLTAVRGAMNPLEGGGWIGKGSDAFFNEMNSDILPAVQRLAEALGEANRVSNQIVDFMQQADEEASASFRDGGAASGAGGVGTGAGAGASAGFGGAFGGGGTAVGGGLESLINSSGFGSSGSGAGSTGFGGSGSLSGSFFGNSLPGSGFGSGMFAGDPFGSGSTGFGLNSNDYGIPRDWLSGVNDSLNGYMSDNYNDYGIPRDWLSDVTAGGSAGSDSGGVSGGSGSAAEGGLSGGGSGGGSGSSDPLSSGGGGSGSGSSPSSDIRDPFGRGTVPNSFGGGFGGTAVSSEAPQAGGLRYQSLGGLGGGAGSGIPAGVPAASAPAGAAAASAAPTNQSGLGLSLGVAAASPFLALLGKAIRNNDDDD